MCDPEARPGCSRAAIPRPVEESRAAAGSAGSCGVARMFSSYRRGVLADHDRHIGWRPELPVTALLLGAEMLGSLRPDRYRMPAGVGSVGAAQRRALPGARYVPYSCGLRPAGMALAPADSPSLRDGWTPVTERSGAAQRCLGSHSPMLTDLYRELRNTSVAAVLDSRQSLRPVQHRHEQPLGPRGRLSGAFATGWMFYLAARRRFGSVGPSMTVALMSRASPCPWGHVRES
jgi:hypothetical protein